MEGAPVAVVEVELRRLLGSLMDGLEVLGDVFSNDHARAHPVAGMSNGGSSGNENDHGGPGDSSGGATA